MNRNAIGWVWVCGQAILLGAIILLPGNDDWPTPQWVTVLASILFFGGLALIAVASLGLGSALTPTPVPTHSAKLSTRGLYQWVRHPIYTGVLAVVAGMTLRSASVTHLALAVVTGVFFDRKAAWEERQLHDRYADYASYASNTPKFLPIPGKRSTAA